MSVENVYGDLLRRQRRACRKLQPEAVRRFLVWEPMLLSGNRGKLNVTTELQAFAMIATAEPYYAVRRPSNLVMMETVQGTFGSRRSASHCSTRAEPDGRR